MALLPPGARGPKVNRRAWRALRIERGLTQTGLGRLADVDASHISRIESGVRTHPSPKITKRVADALGVEVRDLLAADLEAAR
ncbi:MAG TPA: helix-turn-helix transcriptional regulator [Candidatus Limnocylindrales bacterium]